MSPPPSVRDLYLRRTGLDASEPGHSRPIAGADLPEGEPWLAQALAEGEPDVTPPAPLRGECLYLASVPEHHSGDNRPSSEIFVDLELGPRWRAALDRHLGAAVVEGSLDLAEARALRGEGRRVIDAYARVEGERAARAERMPLVTRSEWLVPLGRLSEDVAARVLTCHRQTERWRSLFGGDAPPAQAVVSTALLDEDVRWSVISEVERSSASLAVRCDARRGLRALRARLEGAVGCVFIDPPYNTGRASFAWRDRYSHRAWASLLGEALAAGRALMRPDGVLFATLDDSEVHRLRGLLDEVFGEANFAAQCIWHKKYARQNDATHFSVSHDHVLVAAVDLGRWRPALLPRTQRQDSNYKNRDDDPRGPWQSVVYTCNKTAEQRPNLYYAIRHPRTKEQIWPDRSRVWAYEKETHRRHVAEDRIWWGGSKPRLKKFLSELKGGLVPQTVWDWRQVGDTQEAVRDLASMGLSGVFTSPKPVRLVETAVRLAGHEGGWVLDYFAGSGTTAQAVLRMEHARPTGRRFVLVERADHFDTVLLDRVERAMMAPEWKKGRPFPGERLAGPVHVLHLESLEETFDRKGRGERTFDLVESFVLLAGIEVDSVQTRVTDRRYVEVRGRRGDRRVRIVWRDTADLGPEDLSPVEGEDLWVNHRSDHPEAHIIEPELERLLGGAC